MGQEDESRERCEGDGNGKSTHVEPKGVIKLHPMSNRNREAREVEIYAGSMGGPNLYGVP